LAVLIFGSQGEEQGSCQRKPGAQVPRNAEENSPESFFPTKSCRVNFWPGKLLPLPKNRHARPHFRQLDDADAKVLAAVREKCAAPAKIPKVLGRSDDNPLDECVCGFSQDIVFKGLNVTNTDQVKAL
jgi:hypothetical protein